MMTSSEGPLFSLASHPPTFKPPTTAYAKKAKNRKINDEKGGDKQKKQES